MTIFKVNEKDRNKKKEGGRENRRMRRMRSRREKVDEEGREM